MQQKAFLKLLQSLDSLTAKQVEILKSSLPEPDTLNLQPGASAVFDAITDSFKQSPFCPHCH